MTPATRTVFPNSMANWRSTGVSFEPRRRVIFASSFDMSFSLSVPAQKYRRGTHKMGWGTQQSCVPAPKCRRRTQQSWRATQKMIFPGLDESGEDVFSSDCSPFFLEDRNVGDDGWLTVHACPPFPDPIPRNPVTTVWILFRISFPPASTCLSSRRCPPSIPRTFMAQNGPV